MIQFHSGSGDNVRGDKITLITYKYYVNGKSIDIPKLITNVPLASQTQIIGRIDKVREIRKLYESDHRLVLLKGMGGIGKTTVAKLYVSDEAPKLKHVLWITVSNNLKESFVNDIQIIDSLSLAKEINEIPAHDLVEKGFQLIMNRLRLLKGNNLLIIDSVGEDLERTSTFNQISLAPNWKILITSRIDIPGFQPIEIDELPRLDAERLFYQSYTVEENKKILGRILKLIDYHTMTIEVISKTGEDQIMPLSKIYEALKKKSFNLNLRKM